MDVIDDFVNEYERQFDFWEASARLVHGLLETELASSGLRAIVTSRAKSVDRLAEKLRQRDTEKHYKNAGDIQTDIADLAGVRVALYFPGQMDEVEQLIEVALEVKKVKIFPDSKNQDDSEPDQEEPDASSASGASKEGPDTHRQRFSGYGARHYRVYMRESQLAAGQKRYRSALVEVQVASVLMHAWSEVEHDLVYKPREGKLSPSEYALLDQLNGLVLAGEIALEQLQQAADARVTASDTKFHDHYELAEFLRTRLLEKGIGLTDATLGRVDVLFDYLDEQNAATATSVEAYLDQLKRDFESRPVAAQLADFMLSGDESAYQAFLRAMSASRHPSNRRRREGSGLEDSSRGTRALGEFITAWVLLENFLKPRGSSDEKRPLPMTAIFRDLLAIEQISPDQQLELVRLRNLRNRVLHGRAEDVSPEILEDAAAWLREFMESTGLNNRE